MYIESANEERHLIWAKHVLGMKGWYDDAEAYAVYDQKGADDIRAVIVLSCIWNNSAFLHVASDQNKRFISRRLLRNFASYFFGRRGLSKISVIIDADNTASLSLAIKTGFRVEAALKGGGTAGQDAVQLYMLKSQCSWLPQQQSEPVEGE